MPTENYDSCQRFGVDNMPPEPGRKVGIALGSLDRVALHVVRLAPENDTCGWYIYGGERVMTYNGQQTFEKYPIF